LDGEDIEADEDVAAGGALMGDDAEAEPDAVKLGLATIETT